MAKVLVNESSLTGIANAIRGKNGSTTTYKPSEMAAAITAISGGGEPVIEALSITANGTYTAPDGVDGYSPVTVNVPQDGSPPESAFVISGNCSYRFANNGWNWFLENYGNRITTNNIANASNMFYMSGNIETIPFEINFIDTGCIISRIFSGCGIVQLPSIDFKQTTRANCSSVFQSCSSLKSIGTLKNLYPMSMEYFFNGCNNLRNMPEFENLNMSYNQTSIISLVSFFYGCYSLRSIPEDFLKQMVQPTNTATYYSFFSHCFSGCYALDELKGLNPQTGKITNNMFVNTFNYCQRLKNITFAKQDDGTPYTVNWKKQTIDLTTNVGYADVKSTILNYNSGITADKQVTDATTYAALKDDPDWFTCDVAYSRYNHDSAVATINSLPDTSAYLASAGGTNTIKFKGAAGSATDGGAISSLTPEEIAVATARGWTVSLV